MECLPLRIPLQHYQVKRDTEMRTREEIQEVKYHPEGYKQSWKSLSIEAELLLDIRDLLVRAEKREIIKELKEKKA